MAAELAAHEGSDEEFVDALFRLVLRREPEPEARERALAQLADGTLSRATLVHELATSEEFRRVRELDDAVALGLAARARGERMRWLQAPPGTDERVVEIPWVLSRLRPDRPCARGRLRVRGAGLPRGAAARGCRAGRRGPRGPRRRRHRDGRGGRPLAPVPGSLLRPGAPRVDARARGRRQHGVRPRRGARRREVCLTALRELGACSSAEAACSSRCPLGEPGDHGWFRQEDQQGWTRLLRARVSSSRSSRRTS